MKDITVICFVTEGTT